MRIYQCARIHVATLFAIAALPDPVDGEGTLRVVALSGHVAPGIPDGAVFAEFEGTSNLLPTINNVGLVAFRGQIVGNGVDTANNTGIWSEGDGHGLKLVARLGSPAPGISGDVQFSSFIGRPVFNENGQIAFAADLSGVDIIGPNDSGVWSSGGGTGLNLIARHGDQAPGLGPGVQYNLFNQPLLNAAGHVSFHGYVAGDGITDPYHDGIWSEGHGNGLELVTQYTAQVPGMPEGIEFSGFNKHTFNTSGEVAFEGSISGDGVGPDNNSAIWQTDRNLGLVLVARKSEHAPDLPPEARWRATQNPVLNNSGKIAFNAWLTGGVFSNLNRAIYVGSRDEGFSLVTRSGAHAPGTPDGTTFELFSDVAVNDASQVAFYGNVVGPDVDSTNGVGIWSEGAGNGLALVARTGDPVPGATAGTVFTGFGGNPVVNDLGQTAIIAFLSGPDVNFRNEIGIYVQDQDGQLRAIARQGDQIDVDETDGQDLRTIRDLEVDLSYGTGTAGDVGGSPASLNDRGELVYRATFTDGSAGIIVSRLVAIPEPTSFEIFVPTLVWFASSSSRLGRARRKK